MTSWEADRLLELRVCLHEAQRELASLSVLVKGDTTQLQKLVFHEIPELYHEVARMLDTGGQT